MHESDVNARTEAAPLGGGSKPIESERESASLIEAARPLVAGRYEILGLVGAGAMGTVYRAQDRELDEVVALKMLKKELAAAPGMLERFRREVKLARRVTHRNVARTYDIGEHGGDRFLTMEFIEGESLSRRGRLSVSETLRIAKDLCAGLGAAHAVDILHRDLKPDNVIVATDGRAVISDFGIARALADAGPARTAAGTVMGTPAYMAPEQVEGADDLDARADLYALGAMLFELVTGRPAWPGDSILAIAAARLLKPPPDPRTHLPDLSPGVAELILRLMARKREDRFANVTDTLEAIAQLESSMTAPMSALSVPSMRAPSGATKTIAVLPLLHQGPSDDAYLVQAFTEDLVDLLSAIPQLRVRPRGLTLRFADPSRDVREAGRALDVDVVVDGSIRRFGDTARVSIRLVTVEDGFLLWAKKFEPPAARILDVADAAAKAIATALSTRVATGQHAATVDPVAQDFYLRGRHLLHRGWYEIGRDASELLAKAHDLAPEDPRIAGTYGLSLVRAAGNDQLGPEAERRARLVVEQALAADPCQPEALTGLALMHLFKGEIAAALQALRRTVTIAPNNFEALSYAGRLLTEVGRVDEGTEILGRALDLEPEMLAVRYIAVRARVLSGDRDLDEMLGPEPAEVGSAVDYFMTKARVAMWTGDREAAMRLSQRVAGMTFPPVAATAIHGTIFTVCSRALPPNARQAMDQFLATDDSQSARRASFNAQLRCELFLTVGDLDTAVVSLQSADRHGLVDVTWLERCPSPRSDPRAARDQGRARQRRHPRGARGGGVGCALEREAVVLAIEAVPVARLVERHAHAHVPRKAPAVLAVRRRAESRRTAEREALRGRAAIRDLTRRVVAEAAAREALAARAVRLGEEPGAIELDPEAELGTARRGVVRLEPRVRGGEAARIDVPAARGGRALRDHGDGAVRGGRVQAAAARRVEVRVVTLRVVRGRAGDHHERKGEEHGAHARGLSQLRAESTSNRARAGECAIRDQVGRRRYRISVAPSPNAAATVSQYAGAALSCSASMSHVEMAGVNPPNTAVARL